MLSKTIFYFLLSTNNAGGYHEIGSISLCVNFPKKHEKRKAKREIKNLKKIITM